MGLFDYVIVECPIEGVADPRAMEWQTKSFDCPYMEKYRISPDGRLQHERVRYEDRSDPNAEGLMAFRGAMTPVHEGWDETNYHGDVEMVGGTTPDWRDRVDVTARFTEGQLTWIRRDVVGVA